MKLWHLTRQDLVDYDENLAFVVRADSAEAARVLASIAGKNGGEGAECWLLENRSSCVELKADGPVGIVQQSFRAG